MWPYAAGAALIALFAFKSSSTSAGTGAMFFKDYQWLILWPSTVSNALSKVYSAHHAQLFPGTLDPAQIAALPPPPGQVAGSGKWVEYPGGYQSALGSGVTQHGQAIANPGDLGNPIFPVFPDVPHGMSVYAWRPTTDVLTNVSGYPVLEHHWVFESTDARALPDATGILLYAPKYHSDAVLPPPPGQTGKSGKWHGIAPGYWVWLTPSTTNQSLGAADSASAAWLAQGGTGGGTTNTSPTLSPLPNPAVPPAG